MDSTLTSTCESKGPLPSCLSLHDLNTSFVVMGELPNNLGSNFCIQLDISNEIQNPPLSLHNCSFEDKDMILEKYGIKTEVRMCHILGVSAAYRGRFF